MFGWRESVQLSWAHRRLFVPVDVLLLPPPKAKASPGICLSQLERFGCSFTSRGERGDTSDNTGDSSPEMFPWGSHGTLLHFLSISCEQLSADNIPCFGFVPKNREEGLVEPVVPVCQGRAGCGCWPCQARGLCPAQGRVRVRMKVRTQGKALGKDAFGEAASPSAGKSEQRQQSRWPRTKLERKKGN